MSLCSNSSSTYVGNGVTSEDLAPFGGADAGDTAFVFDADRRDEVSVNGTAVRLFRHTRRLALRCRAAVVKALSRPSTELLDCRRQLPTSPRLNRLNFETLRAQATDM